MNQGLVQDTMDNEKGWRESENRQNGLITKRNEINSRKNTRMVDERKMKNGMDKMKNGMDKMKNGEEMKDDLMEILGPYTEAAVLNLLSSRLQNNTFQVKE